VAYLESLPSVLVSRHAGGVTSNGVERVSLCHSWSLQLESLNRTPCRGTDGAASPREWQWRLLRTAACYKKATIVLCSSCLSRACERRYKDETVKADHVRDDEHLAVGLAGRALCPPVMADDTLVRFEGGIGATPARLNAGVFVANDVQGVNPGGRPWVIKDLVAEVKTNGEIEVVGEGLLLGGGNNVGRTGGNSVVAQLFCGTQAFTSPGVLLEPNGDFKIKDTLSPLPLPAVCATPVLLIRSIDPSTGVLGNWFAAGIPKED
jgi:hypothetical protein